MLAHRRFLIAFALAAVAAAGASARQQEPSQDGQAFRFRSSVELINVNATVTDASGRFVTGLRRDDFRVYQDNELQTITHFDNERVPVSLGILLDTSGSMHGERMAAARRALHRFLYELLGRDDEVFLMKFDTRPQLVQGWTKDRGLVADALARIRPAGGTALYDGVAAAIPMVQQGMYRKKALVIVSDGNDTTSGLDLRSLQPLVRQSEVLIYAVGIDSYLDTSAGRQDEPALASMQQRPRPVPRPFPIPIPGRPRPGQPSPLPPRGPIFVPPPPSTPPINTPRQTPRRAVDDRVNVAALRDITDESGGRTEIIRSSLDLDPATAGIADELSRQYFLGYPSDGIKDGRWRAIRVEVSNPNYRVRARSGFVAQ
jgi:Ca-activated chloride channel homolog